MKWRNGNIQCLNGVMKIKIRENMKIIGINMAWRNQWRKQYGANQ
jgi:hypothetical protein